MFTFKPLSDDFFNLLLAFINNNYQDSSFLRQYFYDFCSQNGFYLVDSFSFNQFFESDKYRYIAYCYNIVDGHENHMTTLEFLFSSGVFQIICLGHIWFSFKVPYSIDFSDTSNLSIDAGFVEFSYDSEISFYPPISKIVLKRVHEQSYETIPYLPVTGFLKVDNNFSLKKFLKTRLFTSDTVYLDSLTSGFNIAAYAEFVSYNYKGSLAIYDFVRENYDITFSYVDAGTFNVQDSNYYRSFCDFDYVEIFSSYDVVVTCVLSSDFAYLDTTAEASHIPSRVDCGFYIDCSDCNKLNAYFLLIFKSLNKIIQNKENIDMDYSNILTQIAQNISMASNDLNTQLENISNKLETTEQIDNSQKSITDVLNQQANTIQIDDIGLLRSKKGYY